MRRPLFCLAAVLVACAIAATVTGGFASAHTGPGTPSTHFLSVVDGIQPALPGVKVAITGRQDPIVLTNGTGRTLTVQGYSAEPYLRFDARGVWMNLRSPNRWLDRPGWEAEAKLPAEADPTAPPQWKLLSVGHVWSWHDARIRWTGAFPTHIVPKGASRFAARNWEIGLLSIGRLHVLHGTLTYFVHDQPSQRPRD